MEPRRGDGCTLEEMATRMSFVVLAAAAAALLATAPAGAKEGVRATLTTAVPLDAAPGKPVKIAWMLTYRDEHGRTRPFGAGAVYVRLLSATGAGAETAYAVSTANGRYSATVAVPEGGIRDVQIALHGFTSGANGTRNADVLFPITNDPVPGVAPVVEPTPGRDWTPWVLVLICAAVLLAVTALRRANVLSRGDGHGRQGARRAHQG